MYYKKSFNLQRAKGVLEVIMDARRKKFSKKKNKVLFDE